MRETPIIGALFTVAFAFYATFVGAMLLWSSRSGGAGSDGGFVTSGIAVLVAAGVLYVLAGGLLVAGFARTRRPPRGTHRESPS